MRWIEVCRTSKLLLGKVLILLVGNCCLGVLIRGLQNLELSRKGTILFFSLVRKEPKVPQRFANLWTPGTIQISARFIIFAEVTGVHHVPGRAGYDNLSGYRRWGFESVRKGGRTSDARLRSFEKGMLYCKLTAASAILKGLLHVSLGTVEKCCLSGFVKSFSLLVGLAWIEKSLFRKQKRFFFVENLSNCT